MQIGQSLPRDFRYPIGVQPMMTAGWKRVLTLAVAASIVAATIDPMDTAHAQRNGRGPSGNNAAEPDRNGGDAGGRRFGGRRGGRGGRSGRRTEPAPQSDDADRSSDTRPSTSVNRSESDRLRDYAVSLVDKYDKNGDKMLQASERTEMRGKPAQADLNHDDVITVDELVTHLSPKPAGSTATRSRPTTTASSASRGGDSEPTQRVYGRSSTTKKSDKSDDKRKSYRFTSPAERLPAGLPSWFKSRDANGDGQVAMHEYSRRWSDRTAAEFVRYDKNNDGVITPAEASRR